MLVVTLHHKKEPEMNAFPISLCSSALTAFSHLNWYVNCISDYGVLKSLLS